MGIKNVHVIQFQAFQALVEAGDEIFARTPFAVRPRPHQITRLAGDDQFVAVGFQIGAENAPEMFLRRTGRRSIIVGQVEMRDAQIERAAHHRPAVFKDVNATKVMPKPERNGGKLETAATAAVVAHALVTGTRGQIFHGVLSDGEYQRVREAQLETLVSLSDKTP